SGLLQVGAVLLLRDLHEGARDAEAQGAGLAADAAAVQAGDHVVLAVEAEHTEGLGDDLLVDLVGEVHREVAAVDLPLSGAGDDAHTRDGLLAPAGAATVALHGLAARRHRRLGGHGLSHWCSFLSATARPG